MLSNIHFEAREGIKTRWDTPIWILVPKIARFCTPKRSQLLSMRDIYFWNFDSFWKYLKKLFGDAAHFLTYMHIHVETQKIYIFGVLIDFGKLLKKFFVDPSHLLAIARTYRKYLCASKKIFIFSEFWLTLKNTKKKLFKMLDLFRTYIHIYVRAN